MSNNNYYSSLVGIASLTILRVRGVTANNNLKSLDVSLGTTIDKDQTKNLQKCVFIVIFLHVFVESENCRKSKLQKSLKRVPKCYFVEA
jgi:hypothetical protein